MPSAEDLIKKVISNNTVNVQIMTPELEKKLEDMEERQTEQHEENIETQKKTKDEFAKISNQGSSNFKEGGEMINKGIKGLTGVDLGGKFNDLKEKMGDLGNIFKGFGRLLKIQGIAEVGGAGADLYGSALQKEELSVTEKLKESIDKQNRLGEKERKSVVATRIQKEQPDNVLGIKEQLEILGATESDLEDVGAKLGSVIDDIADGQTLKFDEITGELSQDKNERKVLVDKIIESLDKFDIDSLGGEFREAFDKNIKDFVENASRLAYELRSVDLNPSGQLEIDPSKDNFGGLRITDEGEFLENPKGILEGLNEKSKEILDNKKAQFKDLSEEQQKTLLSTFGIQEDFIESYGGIQDAVDAISRNTVESVEVLRNTFAKSFEPTVQQENLQQELKQQQNVMSENVDDEQSQMMMNFLSNLPPILGVLKDQLDMDEDQKDKLFGGQKKTGSIVDKDGNPISSEDFKSPMDGVQDALKEGGRNIFDSLVQGAAFGAAGNLTQKSLGGQKPTTPPKQPKGTTTPKGGVKAAGGGLLRGIGGAVAGFFGGAAGIATAVAVAAGVVGTVGLELFDKERSQNKEDLGEGDSDYAKRKKEELDQKRTELQGDERNALGMQKITSESIIDDNTFEGGQGFFDTMGNLLQGSSEIYFDKLNQDDALLRLDQLMAADDLIGDDLSKEDRKRLDQELRDAQTAAQKQLEEMQSETGERLTLEELGKYYDFEVLGENMLKNIQPPAMVTDNSVVNNSTTITSANPRQYDNDVDRAQGAAYT